MKTNSYTAAPLDSHSIVMIDAQTGAQKGEQRITDKGGTILNVTASNNVAAVTYQNANGSTHFILVDLPGGRMHGGQQLTESNMMRRKQTPSRATAANNANVTVLDNGKRYQGSGEGINIWMVALVAWIGWCCLKAFSIWAWGQIIYSFNWWMQ